MPPTAVHPTLSTAPLRFPRTALADVTDAFRGFEERYGLYRAEAAGVRFWEWVRFETAQALLGATVFGGAAQEVPNGRRAGLLRHAGSIAKSVCTRHPFLHEPVRTAWIGHPRRKQRQRDGAWHDLYCDPLLPHATGRQLLLERPYAHRHAEPAATSRESLAHLDAATLAGTVRARLQPFRLDRSSRDQLAELDRLAVEQFEVDLDIARRAQHALAVREAERPIYRQLWSRLAPEQLVVVVGYAHRVAIEAAHDLGITVTELQHGTLSSHHLAYDHRGASAPLVTAADRFLAFGEAFSRSFAPAPGTRCEVTGSAIHDEERAAHPPAAERDVVLFLTQRPYGETLTRWAAESHGALTASAEVREVIVQLHPAERRDWRQRYPWLAQSPVTVIDHDDPGLYALLARTRLQVGVNSTALLEGLTYPLRTAWVPLPGIEHTAEILGSAAALGHTFDGVVVDGPEAIAAAVTPDPAPPPPEAVATLFRANGAQHTIGAIDRS